MATRRAAFVLERQASAKLDLTTGRSAFGDGAELGRIHKAIWSAQVSVVQRVEELASELEFHFLAQTEVAHDGEIKRLHARSVDRVASRVSESECRWSRERSRVEPGSSSLGISAKNRLASSVSANRIFSQHCPRIRGVAEHGDGERESGLNLING